MTRDEKLDWLCRLRSEIYVYMPKEWLIPMNEALDYAIKVLEQEPCDCISREEVCDYIAEFVNHEYATDRERELVKNIIGGIQHLPSTRPKTELETWEGIHAQVKAPKGTFDKIWNEAEDKNEI